MRAHACTGDPAMIYGYLGNGDTFDEALSKFALAYAKQNEEDFLVLKDAIRKGTVKAKLDKESESLTSHPV